MVVEDAGVHPLPDIPSDIRRRLLRPAFSRKVRRHRRHDLLHPRSDQQMAELVLHALLLLGLHVRGQEQGLASLLQVPHDDGYASRDSASDHLVHQQLLPADSFQRTAWDVLLDGDRVYLHLFAS